METAHLEKQIAAMQGQLFFLPGLLTQVFKQLSPAQIANTRAAMASRAKPGSPINVGYSQAEAQFGRESR